MTKREREYYKWRQYVKEQEKFFDPLLFEIGYDQTIESFMGLIPYIRDKNKGIPTSEFQDRCFKYGSGLNG